MTRTPIPRFVAGSSTVVAGLLTVISFAQPAQKGRRDPTRFDEGSGFAARSIRQPGVRRELWKRDAVEIVHTRLSEEYRTC